MLVPEAPSSRACSFAMRCQQCLFAKQGPKAFFCEVESGLSLGSCLTACGLYRYHEEHGIDDRLDRALGGCYDIRIPTACAALSFLRAPGMRLFVTTKKIYELVFKFGTQLHIIAKTVRDARLGKEKLHESMREARPMQPQPRSFSSDWCMSGSFLQ